MKGHLPAVILTVLATEGTLYGLEIVRTVQARSAGVITLTAGGLYPALRRLENKGWVSVEMRRQEHGGGPVNYYTITSVGREAMVHEVAESERFYEALQKIWNPSAPG